MTSSTPDRALTKFLRTLGTAALDLARDLEAADSQLHGHASLDHAGLGSLQLSVAKTPGMDSDSGITPRQIARHLERSDEPNVRTSLMSMQKRGVAEMVPGARPQRWRLTMQYRPDSPDAV